MLNTLQHEFRFVEDGLHSEDNFLRTVSWFTGVINNEEELSCVEAIARGVGFDAKFIELVAEKIAQRRAEIRGAAPQEAPLQVPRRIVVETNPTPNLVRKAISR